MPSGTSLTHPAFLGADRLIFEQGGALWTVPATCDHCAFPSAATRLTADTGNAAPSWSPSSFAAAATTPTPTLSPTPAPAPAPTTAPAPGPTASPTAPLADVVAPVLRIGGKRTSQRVSKVRKVSITVTSSEGARIAVSGRIDVPGKDPVLRRRTATATAGKAVVIRLSLGTTAMRALRTAWARGRNPRAVLSVTATDAAGNQAKVTQRTTLKR